MKRIFSILGVTCLTLGAVFVLCQIKTAQAQVLYENKGIDQGFNNDPYDTRGCVWRDDFLPDGTINYHEEEERAPKEFFIESPPLGDPCDYYSAPDWKKLKKFGEQALWPPGCFDPLNYYASVFATWLGAYGSFVMNENYNTWDEFYYVATGSLNKRTSPGNIDVTLANKSPSYGQEFSADATPMNFSSPEKKMLYGWAMQLPNQKYVSQQGLAAGGRQLSESDVRDFSFPAGAKTNLDTCRRVTRTVSRSNDTDNDGMDDNWERRYAPEGNIREFASEDDTDHDGIDINDPSILNQDNKPLIDSEGVPVEVPNVYNGIHVTPDTTAKSAPGDGTFTNMEEYIWGTNPLDPDSDDDGFPDEADIVGLGQSELHGIVPVGQQNAASNKFTLRATAVGISQLLDERNSGHRKVFIDSDATVVVPGIESDLEASLTSINDTPTTTNVSGVSKLNDGNDVYIEADATRTEGDRAVLDYAWFVQFRNAGNTTLSDKVAVPPTTEFTLDDIQKRIGRMGRYIFRHPVTELTSYVPANYSFDNKPGSFIYVTVEITNLVTHEISTKRIPISIGSDSSMGLNITDLDTGTTMSIEDYVAKYCYDATKQQVPPPAFCSFGGKTYNEILPWIVFQGSRVEVVAQPIQANTSGLVYEWWVNDEKVTEAASDSYDNKLVLYPESSTRDYDVMVKAYTKDAYRNEVFSGEVVMMVEGPQVAIMSQPNAPVNGAQVQLTGTLMNFPENYIKQPGGYSWTINMPDGSTQNLVGKSVNLPSTSAGSYRVELKIAFQGPDGSDRTLTTQKDIVIASGTTTAQAQIKKVFASMASIVQTKSIHVYEFIVITAVVLIGLLYFFGFAKKRGSQ